MATKSQVERGAVKEVYPMWRYNSLGYFMSLAGGYILFILIGSLLYGFLFKPAGITVEQWQPLGSNLALILSFWLNARIRIVIRENGLEYHGFFDGVLDYFRQSPFSVWENLSHIGLEEYSDGEGGIGHRCRLYLKLPAGKSFHIGKIFHAKGPLYPDGWYKEGISPFVEVNKLTQTSFGHYLQVYAPHVIVATRRDHGNQ